MTSAIDPTKPTALRPTMQSVRGNFAHAKAEIEALQALVAGLSDAAVTSSGELLMYGGFNEDIDYHEGTNPVPNFLTTPDGDLYYY